MGGRGKSNMSEMKYKLQGIYNFLQLSDSLAKLRWIIVCFTVWNYPTPSKYIPDAA